MSGLATWSLKPSWKASEKEKSLIKENTNHNGRPTLLKTLG
jgi:hypothetical protein